MIFPKIGIIWSSKFILAEKKLKYILNSFRFNFSITDYQLPINYTNYQLPITDYQFQRVPRKASISNITAPILIALSAILKAGQCHP
ncbi:hypothetical protein BGP_4914 [Beggiatoa sp. PS]|nr:hypothetical protein BGP_4914 [Beggiatoa sp. PS]